MNIFFHYILFMLFVFEPYEYTTFQKLNEFKMENVLTRTQELQNNKERLWVLALNCISYMSWLLASSRMSGLLYPWEICAEKLEIDVL